MRGCRLVLVVVATMVGLPPAGAFTFLTGAETPEGLASAPRWNDTVDAMTAGGGRGLGGGLEFSVDARFCLLVVPSMVDGATCRQVIGAVLEAVGAWERTNPRLVFRDVSTQVRAARDGSSVGDPAVGAEIDLFAESGSYATTGRGARAATDTLTKPGALRGTGGDARVGQVIRSADIVLYARDSCTTLEPAGCYDLTSLRMVLTHEIGHALGLGHPFEHRTWLTLDQPPDCVQPSVRRATFLAPSIMNYETTGLHADSITSDDWAAIDALYPPCRFLRKEGQVVYFLRHEFQPGAGGTSSFWTAAYEVQHGMVSPKTWLTSGALGVVAFVAAWSFVRHLLTKRAHDRCRSPLSAGAPPALSRLPDAPSAESPNVVRLSSAVYVRTNLPPGGGTSSSTPSRRPWD